MQDPETMLAAATGYGLASVRERMNRLGGAMEIRSSPDRGTEITLVIQLERSRERQAGAGA